MISDILEGYETKSAIV